MEQFSNEVLKITDEWDSDRKSNDIEVSNENLTAKSNKASSWITIQGKNEYYKGFHGHTKFYNEIEISDTDNGDIHYFEYGLTNCDVTKYDAGMWDISY